MPRRAHPVRQRRPQGPTKILDRRGRWHYYVDDEPADKDTYKDAVHDITKRHKRKSGGVGPLRIVSNLVAAGLGLVATAGGGFGIDVLGDVLNDVISV